MTFNCKWADRYCDQVDDETGMCATEEEKCKYIEDYDESLCILRNEENEESESE